MVLGYSIVDCMILYYSILHYSFIREGMAPHPKHRHPRTPPCVCHPPVQRNNDNRNTNNDNNNNNNNNSNNSNNNNNNNTTNTNNTRRSVQPHTDVVANADMQLQKTLEQ